MQEARTKQLEKKLEEMTRRRDDEIHKIERAEKLKIDGIQDAYKRWALLLPPILPLLLAGIVFLYRRAAEREGVERSRLR